MATPSNFKTTPYAGLLENTEFNFHSLYMHRIFSGPKPNQAKLIDAEATTGNGLTAVNDWPIYDGPGPDAKVVARAQGMHMFAGNWYNSTIVSFKIGRFKGSTLEVMGRTTSDEQADDWAIVGGTGVLEMARGVIRRQLPTGIDGGVKQEITIYGFCRSPNPPKPKRFGPWGGTAGGTEKDITATPVRLESITVHYTHELTAIQYSYIDSAGKVQNTDTWGTASGNKETIQLSSSEFVTEVSGTYTWRIISSIKFVTNEKTYGPYGQADGTAFKADVPAGSAVAGLFTRIGTHYPVTIGVYTLEN